MESTDQNQEQQVQDVSPPVPFDIFRKSVVSVTSKLCEVLGTVLKSDIKW
jgi:hypothetical protein